MRRLYPAAGVLGVLILWQAISSLRVVPGFMLPSPLKVGATFVKTLPAMLPHLGISMAEALLGLVFGVLLAFFTALFMDRSAAVSRILYPLLVITQAVPVVAIAPLLVLWFGYGVMPKVVLVLIVCFFPLAIGFYDGLRSADRDSVSLLRAMSAGEGQIFWHLKFPGALPSFFSGLKISVSYAIVGAVIAEWLGGSGGLGVYMTQVRRSFAFDKMFAVILLIIIISLLAIYVVKLLERRAMPYRFRHSLDKQDHSWEE